MAGSLKDLLITVTAGVGKAQAGLKAVVTGLDKTGKAAQRTSSRFSRAMAKINRSVTAVRAGINKYGRSVMILGGIFAGAVTLGVKGLMDLGRAQARLTHLTKTTSNATKEQIAVLMEQAAALEQLGVVEEDVVMIGQSQLATFALNTEQIKKLTPGLLDMIVAVKGAKSSQEDALTVANALGKSFDAGIGSLTRYGITLTDMQRELFGTATRAEKVGLLVKILEANFAGLNEATRKTARGGLKALRMELDGLLEGIVKDFLPAMNKLVQAFTPVIKSEGAVGKDLKWLVDLLTKVATSAYVTASLVRRSLTNIYEWGKMRFRQLGEEWDLFVSSLKQSWTVWIDWFADKWESIYERLKKQFKEFGEHPYYMGAAGALPPEPLRSPEPPKPKVTVAEVAEANRNAARVQMLKHIKEQRALRKKLGLETKKWADEITSLWNKIFVEFAEPIDRAKTKIDELGDAVEAAGDKTVSSTEKEIAVLQMRLRISDLIASAQFLSDKERIQAQTEINRLLDEWLAASTDERKAIEDKIRLLELSLDLQRRQREAAGIPSMGGYIEDMPEGEGRGWQAALPGFEPGAFGEGAGSEGLAVQMKDVVRGGVMNLVRGLGGFLTQILTTARQGVKKMDWGKQAVMLVLSVLGGILTGIFVLIALEALKKIPVIGALMGQHGGISKGEGLIFMHRNELMAPMDTVKKLMAAILPPTVNVAPAAVTMAGGGGRTLSVGEMNVSLENIGNAEELLADLSDTIDAEMDRGAY